MLNVYDNHTLAAALAQPIAPDLATILRDRWSDAEALGLGEHSHILLIQPGDELAEVEQEIGFRPTINPIDGTAFGAREFSPYWSRLEDVGPAFELIHTVGTDFAYIILAEKAEGVPKALLDMCTEYSADAGADEFDGGEVVFGALVVAGGDAAEVLDAVEEALDEIALAVEPAREREALLAVGAQRDVGPGVLAGGGFTDSVAVISLVGQQGKRRSANRRS